MSDPPGADGKCQIRVLCMDCNESHAPGEGVHKYGKSWKCAKCHSAQRWLRENDPDWSGKSAQEKTELVLANRDHGGRGCARRLQTCHKVEVDHYENRDDEVPYLTKNRFIHKGMKWYGWTPEQAEDEWDKAVRDVNVKRRKDEYGELTIAKLKTAVHHVGVRVGNKRSIGETKKFNAEDQEAITDAKECVLRFRMDVEVGMSLPSIGDDDAGFARPKAKPKAKGGPKKASKKPKALGDGENENSEPSRKKARVDKEAKQRLDALKLQTDMVHMSQKWTSRIKTLNIEVTASIQSCQDFPHLAPLRDEVLKAFEKYAVAGPAVCASPSLTNTRLAMIQDSSVEPAPEVKVSRSAALVEPTKQGLQQYDKMMLDLESTLNRFIKQLDKETQEAQEVKEKNRILQEQLEKRLAKKKAASESAIEKGKKAGLRAAALEDSESGAGAKGTVVQAHDATTDDAGNDEGECEWKVGAELASRLEDTLPCENTVDLKHELAFIQPTVFGFPDAVDFTNYGYSIDFSCEIYKKNIPDEEEGDGANEMEGNPAYTSTTMLKDIVDPKTAINEKERIILDTVLFGPMKARECLGIDYPTSEYIKMLQGRLQYTGPEFTWCGLGKLFWGKMVCILSGERITAGIPISHFVGDIEGGANFGDINTKFTRMSRDDVVKAGGFWAYLRQGQGIVIPPAYIIMDINRGAMDYTADAEDEETAIAAVDTMVFPTLTKDQIDNFDTSVYEVAIKACSGVFEKFGNELASGKELTNIVRAAVLSRTKHEDKTPSKEHTQLVEGTTEYINGSWTNAPESLSIALEMADKLFQLICRKAVDSDMDTDGSQQAALYSRVVDLLTGPLTSKVVTMGEMYDVGKQRQPHSEEFDTLWDDLIANAHHRIHCAMDDGDDLVAKLSKLSEPEIDILCKHVSLMDVFPTFQKWIQMTHGEQDLEFGDSNADRACQLHDFTHFMDSMQGETWDAFQVLLNIKSGGLVSSAASGADKSTVVDLGKPNPSQAAEHVDTTMEKISPEASLPDTLPAQFPEKNDEAPAYEAKSPPPAKPMASSAAKSPTMLPPSVPKQSEALAKNASPVPALQPPIPKPIEAVAKSISAAAPPPKATPPGEEEPKGAKPTAMKSAQTSSKAMTSVSVEASSTEKTDKVDVAGGKATMETIGGVPVAKSPVAKPTTKAKAAAEPDNTAKPIPAAKAKTMSVPKAKAKADATPTPSVAEETTKKKRHSKQDQVDNFFNISQRKASKDKEPKTPKTSTSKASAKGKTKK